MNIIFWDKKPMVSKPLRALLLISSAFIFANAMFMPIYALFVEKIGGSITTASTAYAIFWLVAGVLTFIAGKIENKMKETELAIMLSQFIVCIGYILYYFTDTIFMLYIVMVILGIANAIFWPAFHCVYTKHVDGQKSAWQWSFYDGLTYIVPAIGAFIGGWLVKLYGFNVIFIIMAVIAFLNGIFIGILPRKVL